MAWFLGLQGPPSKMGQSVSYELQESVDIAAITQQLLHAAGTDGVVAIPVVFPNGRQHTTVYLRPTAWGSWAFYQMTEAERRELLNANPLISALAQAQAAKQPRMPQQPAGPAVIPRLD